jgi:hypothetical protein
MLRQIALAIMALAWLIGGIDGWLAALAIVALLATVVALVAFAVADWRTYRRRGARRGYRRRRTAHERFAASVDLQRSAAAEDVAAAPPAVPQAHDEDELLRQLLGQ